ncbi:tRNA (guanosine(46)-N7)-methyltransferase TrmB [Marinoscillum sp. MHG1-6]|uniref:tRNA (guanosine(46)-N7)-methyltransferase TrmB n=1 Tax=Marinoscillum sp. MHG1-6 TaxID=2959627 RepID=UPI00215796E9|nr:tRNA (guanosine(46)-N7)-methyltransferase TrmB [Marinoscillum sp. MHG1-6]
MRKKLKRFAENHSRDNIIQPGKPLYENVRGSWNSDYFKEENPIVVELACGDGEYTVGLAQAEPSCNYIGIDIKGDRLYQGSTLAMEYDLTNVGFLRTQIHLLENFFDENEISEIWLTFPDPRPRDRDEKRRLTHTRFLNMYKKLVRKDGWFKFKTDNTALFDYTLEVLQNDFPVKNLEYTHDLYQTELVSDHYGIKTKYERIWSEKGEKIKYLKFQF